MMTGSDLRCPGALHAVEARDGLLARVRVPGGLITHEQLAALARLARRCGTGVVEITSRANVQLRGLNVERLNELAAGLLDSGLVRSVAHDRVRNVVASPLAGLDRSERLDVRPLVRDLDAAVTSDDGLASLPAKFAFVLDGGGRPFDPGRADLAATAVAGSAGETVMHLAIGGRSTGFGVRPQGIVDALVRAARIAIALAAERDPADRRHRLSQMPEASARIVAALGRDLVPAASPAIRSIGAPPLGILPALRPDRLSVVPSVPLGYLTAMQTDGIAALAQWYEADLRLAPWRGIILGNVARPAAIELAHAITRLGLATDESDGFAGVAACAGTQGCDAALADVRSDAAQFAGRLAEAEIGGRRTVIFAGCEKRCGMRRGADLEFVADVLGYDVRIDGSIALLGASSGEAIAHAAAACAGVARKISA